MHVKPIGIVHTIATDDTIRYEFENIETQIEIYSEYSDGLDGLDGFSHIFVLALLNKLRPDQIGVLKVKPRHLLRKGFKINELPTRGVFALSSPSRPNPLGLSLVELLKIDGRWLRVKGLDYFDGTPILDIKPFKGNYKIDRFSVPDWYAKIREAAGEF